MNSAEEYAFTLILHSGNAKSSAYEALALVKQSDFEGASIKMEDAEKELVLAKQHHAKLLRKVANAEKVEVSVLLLHAEDHITSAEMGVDMVRELKDIYTILERIGAK